MLAQPAFLVALGFLSGGSPSHTGSVVQRSLASWVNLTVTIRGASPFPPNGFIPTITTLCFPPLPAPPNAASSSLVTTAPRSPPTRSLLPLAVATIRDGLLPWLFRGGQGAPPPPQAVAGTVPQRPRPGNRLDPLCSVSPVARSSSRVCFVLFLPLFDRVLGLDGSDRLIESVCDVGSGRAAGFAEES